jgi:hypothetical protein
MINYKYSDNFKSHLIIEGTQKRLVKLLCFIKLLNRSILSKIVEPVMWKLKIFAYSGFQLFRFIDKDH